MTGKIYLENPYLKELKATVLEKEKKGNKYHFVLNRTIFLPRSSFKDKVDKGYINEIEVLDVFEQGEKIIHVLGKDIDAQQVFLEIEWNKRFDFMQQHTGAHILNASMTKLCDSFNSEVEVDSELSIMTIDCISLNDMDISRIEKFANHMIYSNFELTTRIEKKEDKRLVSIDNIYSSVCESIHCSSTGEVGIIKIIDFRKKDSQAVMEFVCGSRALRDYEIKNNIIKELKDLLSVDDKCLVSEIETIIESLE